MTSSDMQSTHQFAPIIFKQQKPWYTQNKTQFKTDFYYASFLNHKEVGKLFMVFYVKL